MNDWHQDAACANETVDIWFDPGHERLALNICSACTVRSKCLAAAFDEERGLGSHARHGIRGGLTSIERTNAGTEPSRTVLDDPVLAHGSRSLYRKGCRCAACTEAQAAYHRDWEQRRRSKRGSA